MLSRSSSERAPDNWIRATGMSRIRSQNESVFERRPQFTSFFGDLGGIGTGITASSRCTEGDGSSPRDPTRIRPGTRSARQNQQSVSGTGAPLLHACVARRKSPMNAVSVPVEGPSVGSGYARCRRYPPPGEYAYPPIRFPDHKRALRYRWTPSRRRNSLLLGNRSAAAAGCPAPDRSEI